MIVERRSVDGVPLKEWKKTEEVLGREGYIYSDSRC